MKTEQIWFDLNKELEGFIRSRVKDTASAEDILQETFIKIHLHLNTLKDERSTKAWVYQVARNLIQDHYRKHRRFENVEAVDVPAREESTDNDKFMSCMMPFIKRLPEKYRQAVELADLQKLNQKQLATKLNISYSGVKSRVQRARNMLHSYFTDCCDILNDKYGNIISHEPKGKCICSG